MTLISIKCMDYYITLKYQYQSVAMAIPPISFDHDKNKGDNYHLNILYMQY